MNDSIVLALRPSAHSAGIGRTGTFIVIDILIDIIRVVLVLLFEGVDRACHMICEVQAEP